MLPARGAGFGFDIGLLNFTTDEQAGDTGSHVGEMKTVVQNPKPHALEAAIPNDSS